MVGTPLVVTGKEKEAPASTVRLEALVKTGG